jgi:hypothetical protein
MDQKLSEMSPVSGLTPGDIIPIVTGGVNRTVTAGVFGSNLPNLGIGGMSKFVPFTQTAVPLNLTKTVISLTPSATPYTLAAGTEGQVLILLSPGAAIVTFNSTETATFSAKGSLIMVYSGSWFVISNRNATLT